MCIMISIDLDLSNKRKITTIDFIGTVNFPAGYFAHLIKGLDYTTFLPFISLKPQRLVFIYWQPFTESCFSLEYLTDLRSRLVQKYYTGDTMKVKDYTIGNFKGKTAHFLSGVWENQKYKLKGSFELMALKHEDLLVLFDIEATIGNLQSDSMKELKQIRESFTLNE